MMKKATENRNIHLPTVSSVVQRFDMEMTVVCVSLSSLDSDDLDVGMVPARRASHVTRGRFGLKTGNDALIGRTPLYSTISCRCVRCKRVL